MKGIEVLSKTVPEEIIINYLYDLDNAENYKKEAKGISITSNNTHKRNEIYIMRDTQFYKNREIEIVNILLSNGLFMTSALYVLVYNMNDPNKKIYTQLYCNNEKIKSRINDREYLKALIRKYDYDEFKNIEKHEIIEIIKITSYYLSLSKSFDFSINILDADEYRKKEMEYMLIDNKMDLIL